MIDWNWMRAPDAVRGTSRLQVFLATSWKNRALVREAAIYLREADYLVYDFTDPECRKESIIPPERHLEAFDPTKHCYREYLQKPDWRAAVNENRQRLDECDACLLLLPCGADSHSDWAYALGRGKPTCVVGHPHAGDRSPVHLWADAVVDDMVGALAWLNGLRMARYAQTHGISSVPR